jgi:ATP-dependent 26S proteasome regulatory subunit
VHIFVLADGKHEERDEEISEKDEKIKRITEEKDKEIKRKDEEIKRKEKDEIRRIMEEKDEEIKRNKKEINQKNSELKKEIHRISKIAWPDFVGEGFEIENGVLGLDRDAYLNIVKFIDSSILRKV